LDSTLAVVPAQRHDRLRLFADRVAIS